MRLTEKAMLKVFRDFRLTENEFKVYILLAKGGFHKGGEISKKLRMHKAQVYRILKNLENRGIVESTLEFPARFIAVPFKEVLDLFIKAKRDELSSLEDKKTDLLAYWNSISVEKPENPPEKFSVIEGTSNIYSKILQMVEETKREILIVTTDLGVIRADQAGIAKAGFAQAAQIVQTMGKSHIQLAQARILAQVSKENLNVIKRISKEISKTPARIELRHINLASGLFPHFVLKDGETAMFFVTPKEDISAFSQEDTGLWTNSKVLVCTLKAFFEQLWHKGTNLNKRIHQIETGKTHNTATIPE
jgi:sugar-specific transcriptional regulator TrmB